MSNPIPSLDYTIPLTRQYSPFAAFLSYLVPGLGQIYQGRVAKGLLFLVCLYGLFFYGMYLGDWCNVYLPSTAERNNPYNLPAPLANVYNRLPYGGQFWIGIAAWPALWHHNNLPVPSAETSPFLHNFQRTPPERRSEATQGWRKWREDGLNEMQTNGDKTWDLGWVCTVIAGVLNIMVIYDAFAGPAFVLETARASKTEEAVPA